jgi:chromosome segregation ATPase
MSLLSPTLSGQVAALEADLSHQKRRNAGLCETLHKVEKTVEHQHQELGKLESKIAQNDFLKKENEDLHLRGASYEEELRDLRCRKHVAETDFKNCQEANKKQFDQIKDLEARLSGQIAIVGRLQAYKAAPSELVGRCEEHEREEKRLRDHLQQKCDSFVELEKRFQRAERQNRVFYDELKRVGVLAKQLQSIGEDFGN